MAVLTPGAADAASTQRSNQHWSKTMQHDPTERILVVRRADLADLPAAGFLPCDRVVRRFLQSLCSRVQPMRRDVAERDPEHIQIVALAYVEHAGRLLVLPCDEGDASRELYGKHAIWFGGHVEARDPSIVDGLRRELWEELGLPEGVLTAPELVGLVRNDATPRSTMHVGVVHRVRALDTAITALARPERMLVSGRYQAEPVAVETLWAQIGRLEPWSQFILRHLRSQMAGIESSAAR